MSIQSPLKVGLLGLGTVASGVARILETNQAAISRKLGRGLVIAAALVRDPGRPRAVAGVPLTTDPRSILADPGIDMVAELMGGIEPARTYILDALASGKDVVTANKDLMAAHGRELLAAASAAGRDLRFEGSVAGGIPIVAALKESLAGNRISRLAGIVNGTTNYILTAMAERGAEYGDVLREAQELGYAEADPSADVDGFDAARKLAILAAIAFGSRIRVEDMLVEGISGISQIDLAYAREFGSTCKLLAIAEEKDGAIEARVHPTLLPGSHPLSSVAGVYNAIYVVGDAVGETMFYGRGAGALPTGSSVVADLIQVARDREGVSRGHLNCTCYRALPMRPAVDLRSAFYVRLRVRDEVRVLASIAALFAEANVSFASIIQRPIRSPLAEAERRNSRSSGEAASPQAADEPRGVGEAEIVLVTHPCREGEMRAAVAALKRHDKVKEVCGAIRVGL